MADSDKKGVMILLVLVIIVSIVGVLAVLNAVNDTVQPSPVMEGADKGAAQAKIMLNIEEPKKTVVTSTTGRIILNIES